MEKTVKEALEEATLGFVKEARELFPLKKPVVLESVPTALEFYRNYVSTNTPVIIKNAAKEWPAISKWKSDDYLESILKENPITVDFTPDGCADSIWKDEIFITPHTQKMTFKDFLSVFQSTKRDPMELPDSETSKPEGFKSTCVPYIQHQNDNFSQDFSSLWGDIPKDIAFASEAFNAKPDAINFWMGDERSLTSLHKDHYENLYVVISGEKIFTLFPPFDYYLLYEKFFPSGHWDMQIDSNAPDFKKYTWHLNKDLQQQQQGTQVPWIQVDPEEVDYTKFPLQRHAQPYTVVISEGDVLYLPALWYHHVRQIPDDNGRTIAVNYWYDMQFDIKYQYWKLLESYSHILHNMDLPLSKINLIRKAKIKSL